MSGVPSEPDALEAALRRAQRGEVVAFNSLVEHFQRQVYNVCFRTLGNSEDAADASQDAFISAFRGIGTFRGPADGLRGWLLRIAVNACYDALRRRRRRPADSLEALEDAAAFDVADPEPDPEQRSLMAEGMSAIEAAMSRLAPDQRLAVVLCDVQGLSYEEAAQAMAVELGTVKSRLSRARAQLRDVLRANGELPAAARRLEHRNP
jgi:RNA polymerase sigma-70 factor (ECF subfamily)